MFRGVISSPSVLEPQQHGFMVKGGLAHADLNYYALYWDKIVIPDNRAIKLALPAEEQFVREGVLERPLFDLYHSKDMITKTAEKQIELLHEFRSRNRAADWHIHNIGNEYCFPSEREKEKASIRFEILNSLPVPPQEVSLREILKFKKKQKNALSDLHNYLDEVYKEVITNPEDPLFKAKSYLRMEATIKAINILSEQKWGGRLLRYSFSFDFSSKKDVIQAFMGGASALSGGNGIQTFLDLGQVALSMIKITDRWVQPLGLGDDGKNLMFLAQAYNKKIL